MALWPSIPWATAGRPYKISETFQLRIGHAAASAECVMEFDLEKHHRRSIRLPGYDYSRMGAYFVTVCTHNRMCLFGDVLNGEMHPNPIGCIVVEEWRRSAAIRQEIGLDAFALMPNHLHGIVIIQGTGERIGATGRSPLPGPGKQSLASFLAGFKSATAKRINLARGAPGAPVWQRNYYEHIIREQADWDHILEYIASNPALWAKDRENPNGQAS
jgi:putative transposase